MKEGATRTQPGKVLPLRVAEQPPSPLEQVVDQAFRIGIGLAVIAYDVVGEAVAGTLGRERPTEEPTPADEESPPASGLPLLAGATIGAALEMGRWSTRAATTLLRSGELFLSILTGPGFIRRPLDHVGTGLSALDARWQDHRPRDEEAASTFLRLLIPQVVDATLDQVDLNELVRTRVDADKLVEAVDLDRAVARLDIDVVATRLDIDAIVDRLDLDQVLQRVDMRMIVDRVPIEDVLERVDVDRTVARVDLDRVVERIDIDAVAARLDVEAVVRRLDLAAIAREVIDEIDLPEIIRDAMGSMTTETVGGIRVQSMAADRAISRLVDRVLQRRRDRDAEQTIARSDKETG